MAARIIVEGWRGAPIGYASVFHGLVGQLAQMPEIEVFVRDLPYWSESLRPAHTLLPAAEQSRLDALPTVARGLNADALVRIASPLDTTPSALARKTFVWTTADVGILEASRVAFNQSPAQALNQRGVDFITCSAWARDGLVRSGASPARVSVVPCGFDPAVYSPVTEAQRDDLRRAMGWQDRFVFLNVGSLSWTKGIRLLLTAFAFVAQRFPNAVLALKGSNEWLASDRLLQENLAALPPEMASVVAPRLAYIGDTLPAERLAQLYNSADALVHPYHAESFALPVLEAAACGTPVVVPSGGPTDEFTDPSFAVHVRARAMTNADLSRVHGEGAQVLNVDGDHLVEQMSVLMNDPGIRLRAREHGPAWLRERFTWKHAADKLLQLILPPVHPGWL